MTMRRRALKFSKWVAAFLSLLSVVAWVLAANWEFGVRLTSIQRSSRGYEVAYIVGFERGEIGIALPDLRDRKLFWFEWTGEDAWLSRRFAAEFGARRFILFPAWVPSLVMAIATITLFRLDRRRVRPGHCRCGYDLTGNVSGKCPECGAETGA